MTTGTPDKYKWMEADTMAKTDLKGYRAQDTGAWDTMFVLNARRPNGILVYIRAAKDAEAERRWQVARLNSTVLFSTLCEARDYCRQFGWA